MGLADAVHHSCGIAVAIGALKYPEVTLEVTTEDRPVDMIEEGYDLVIRVNPDPDESLVGRAFLRDRLVVVASPDLPRTTRERAAPGVARGAGELQTWHIKTQGGRSTITIEPVLVLSTLIMVRDAVRAGVGAGRLPVSLVAHDLADGTLVNWGDIDGSEISLWTLYPSRRLLSARVSAFLGFLKQAFPNGTPDELAAYIGRWGPKPLSMHCCQQHPRFRRSLSIGADGAAN
ncbi:LysR family transcriptional regulator [Mesorhizobium loti]|nr:LysR family transcriptional regulator [Mesorhizobium loti]